MMPMLQNEIFKLHFWAKNDQEEPSKLLLNGYTSIFNNKSSYKFIIIT